MGILCNRINKVNALGRTNLSDKDVSIPDTATTYEIMQSIADVSIGGGGGDGWLYTINLSFEDAMLGGYSEFDWGVATFPVPSSIVGRSFLLKIDDNEPIKVVWNYDESINYWAGNRSILDEGADYGGEGYALTMSPRYMEVELFLRNIIGEHLIQFAISGEVEIKVIPTWFKAEADVQPNATIERIE